MAGLRSSRNEGARHRGRRARRDIRPGQSGSPVSGWCSPGGFPSPTARWSCGPSPVNHVAVLIGRNGRQPHRALRNCVDQRARSAPCGRRRSGARGPAAPRRPRRPNVSVGSGTNLEVVNGGSQALTNAHLGTLDGERFAPYRGQSYGVDRVNYPCWPTRPRASAIGSHGVLNLWRSGPGAVSRASRVRGGWRGSHAPAPRPIGRTWPAITSFSNADRSGSVLGHLQRGSVAVHVGRNHGKLGNTSCGLVRQQRQYRRAAPACPRATAPLDHCAL